MGMEINDVLKLAYELKDALRHDERVLSLTRIEREMNADMTVIALANHMQERGAFFASLREEDEEYQPAQKRLHLAKLALDENELVKRYHAAYKEVRLMYASIQEKIFTPFNIHFCGDIS